MGKLNKEDKRSIRHKLLEFKRTGLESYAAYLETQRAESEGKELKKHYLKYIEKEIATAAKRIAKIDSKLSKRASDS